MDVSVEFEKPVAPPVQTVTLVLTLEEAQMLKMICNYRRRVGALLQSVTGLPLVEPNVKAFLFSIWRPLHSEGIHANPQEPSKTRRGTTRSDAGQEH